jgi:hypothetical protein
VFVVVGLIARRRRRRAPAHLTNAARPRAAHDATTVPKRRRSIPAEVNAGDASPTPRYHRAACRHVPSPSNLAAFSCGDNAFVFAATRLAAADPIDRAMSFHRVYAGQIDRPVAARVGALRADGP